MIVCVKTNKGYLIGQDITVNIDGIPLIDGEFDNDPLFPLDNNPNVIMAVSDSFREASFFKYIPDLYPYRNFNFKTIVRNFVPALYNEKCKMHFAKENEAPTFETDLIIAKKTKAFGISKRGSVYEVGESEAIGYGEEGALGSLHVTRNDKDPFKRLLLAFYEANKRSHLVSLNLLIADTSKEWGGIKLYSEDEILEKIKEYQN